MRSPPLRRKTTCKKHDLVQSGNSSLKSWLDVKLIPQTNKQIVICYDRGRDLKEFLLRIQSEMEEPRLVKYSFIMTKPLSLRQPPASTMNSPMASTISLSLSLAQTISSQDILMVTFHQDIMI